jgi:hypothetical protein
MFSTPFFKIIIGVSQNRVTIISTFPFRLIFLCLIILFYFPTTNPIWEICLSSILWKALTRAIWLSNLFSHQPIIMSYNFRQGFFPFVYLFPLLIAFTSLAPPLSFLLVLNLIFKFVYVQLVVQLCKCSIWLPSSLPFDFYSFIDFLLPFGQY